LTTVRTAGSPAPGSASGSRAAASILAKVERDGLLSRLARQYPPYAWDQNKGYSAPAHLDALRRLGPTPQHRRSWNLRVLAESDDLAAADGVTDSAAGSAGSPADDGGTAGMASLPLADLGGMMSQ
jgi:ribonuclease HII